MPKLMVDGKDVAHIDDATAAALLQLAEQCDAGVIDEFWFELPSYRESSHPIPNHRLLSVQQHETIKINLKLSYRFSSTSVLTPEQVAKRAGL